MSDLVYNLNYNIKVKLKDKGFQHLAYDHNKYVGMTNFFTGRDAEYYKIRVDEEGYTTFQLWSFMDLFSGLGMSLSEYCETGILLSTEDLNLEKNKGEIIKLYRNLKLDELGI